MDDIINKLDDDTKRWYLSNEVGDILSALIIGKEIFTSSYYKTNKDQYRILQPDASRNRWRHASRSIREKPD